MARKFRSKPSFQMSRTALQRQSIAKRGIALLIFSFLDFVFLPLAFAMTISRHSLELCLEAIRAIAGEPDAYEIAT